MSLGSIENRLGRRRIALLLGLLAAASAWTLEKAIGAGWIASVGLAVVLGIGVFLYWMSPEERKKTGELGRSVVTAALVGLAFAAAQASASKRDHAQEAERQMWSERQSLALTLSLQTQLRGINLGGRDLAAFFLRDRDMVDAQLENTDLCAASLTHTNLKDASLETAAMRYADLENADLERVELWGADLDHADLDDANLQGADLRYANLDSAVLAHADLRGADLAHAIVGKADLIDATYDGRTVWPHGSALGALGARRGIATKVQPQRLNFRPARPAYKPRCFSPIWRHAKLGP